MAIANLLLRPLAVLLLMKAFNDRSGRYGASGGYGFGTFGSAPFGFGGVEPGPVRARPSRAAYEDLDSDGHIAVGGRPGSLAFNDNRAPAPTQPPLGHTSVPSPIGQPTRPLINIGGGDNPPNSFPTNP